ncbi:hypothetical protein DMUE_2899 [Dictyocoela muelleri]|nr:hypothetical protein DMUE_2899 [Dictyocoela muelleri]
MHSQEFNKNNVHELQEELTDTSEKKYYELKPVKRSINNEDNIRNEGTLTETISKILNYCHNYSEKEFDQYNFSVNDFESSNILGNINSDILNYDLSKSNETIKKNKTGNLNENQDHEKYSSTEHDFMKNKNIDIKFNRNENYNTFKELGDITFYNQNYQESMFGSEILEEGISNIPIFMNKDSYQKFIFVNEAEIKKSKVLENIQDNNYQSLPEKYVYVPNINLTNENFNLNNQSGSSIQPNEYNEKQINKDIFFNFNSGLIANDYSITENRNSNKIKFSRNKNYLNNQDSSLKTASLNKKYKILEKKSKRRLYKSSCNDKNRFRNKFQELKTNLIMKIKKILPDFEIEKFTANEFINISNGIIDIKINLYLDRKLFRIKKKEDFTLQKLIDEIENDYGSFVFDLANEKYEIFIECK